VTVSDKKLVVGNYCDPTIDKNCDPTGSGITGYYYKADVITANDYYPFGMNMPGRSFSVGGKYRYGFNGKENDKDISEGGQDYGMRIYDMRLGRFLSVDPLTKQYPELTPYQFASNCPISGVDLDGMEYLTAIYNITIKNGLQILTSSFVWKNSWNHSETGVHGQGVTYKINIKNLDNHTSLNTSYFVSRAGNNSSSKITNYGNYMGAATLPNFSILTGSKVKNTFRYDVPAINSVDQLAKIHDQGYDRINAVGAASLFNDWAATPYDEAAFNGWTNFYNEHQITFDLGDGDKYFGSIDPFNGQSVSQDQLDAALRGKTLFSTIIVSKKRDISTFMEKNYKKEAKSTNFTFFSTRKKIEYNYQLFLEKYMIKDKDGNYTRREEMWDGDKDKGFTPKTPTP
jgi:RHS repeat-associated protein